MQESEIATLLVGIGATIWFAVFTPRSILMRLILGFFAIAFLIYGLTTITLEYGSMKIPFLPIVIIGGVVGCIAAGLAWKQSIKHLVPAERPKEADEIATRQQIPAPAFQPSESKSFPPRKLPPLIKQGAVSTLIPFNKDGMSAGIPYEKNTQDPLMMTYIALAGIGRMPTRYAAGAGFTPVSDNEAASFTGDVLRYYILRSIVELQNKETLFSYQSERGMTTTTTSPVAVPEAQPYPKDQLDKLLAETKFGLDHGEQLRVWKRYKLEVPTGTIISLSDRSVTLKKEGYFTLRFEIEPAGRNIGVLPVNFIPAEKLDQRNIASFVFTVSMRFEWYRDYAEAEPYKEWAQSLFSGLEKRLKQPPL